MFVEITKGNKKKVFQMTKVDDLVLCAGKWRAGYIVETDGFVSAWTEDVISTLYEEGGILEDKNDECMWSIKER